MRSNFCYVFIFLLTLSSSYAAVGSNIVERTNGVQHLVLSRLEVSEEDYTKFIDTIEILRESFFDKDTKRIYNRTPATADDFYPQDDFRSIIRNCNYNCPSAK